MSSNRSLAVAACKLRYTAKGGRPCKSPMSSSGCPSIDKNDDNDK